MRPIREVKQKYHGITYPPSLSWVRRIWKRLMCPRGIHLLDEVLSSACTPGRDYERKNWSHYLYCDACGLTVHIAEIEGNG